MDEGSREVVAPTAPAVRPWIREIEPLARRAFPALEEERHEGWIFRASGGTTRRANSVHAEGPVRDVGEAVAAARAWYARRGLPLRLYLHSASEPEGLAARLAGEGWAVEGGALVLVASLAARAPTVRERGNPPVRLDPEPSQAWLDRFCGWRALTGPDRANHAAILARLPAGRVFATAGGDLPRSVGVGVVEAGWLGLFEIVTDPAARRQGWGRQVVEDILEWGTRSGARRAYLQVTADNAAARPLYARLGFATAYAYEYRAAPP